MYLAVKCCPPVTRSAERRLTTARSSVDGKIRDFLSGRTDGESLLHTLYDHVLDEPIPERLRNVLKG